MNMQELIDAARTLVAGDLRLCRPVLRKACEAVKKSMALSS
jgi:hypothetical protein